MILTCPQCETRYQVDGSKFPAAGRNVRCAKCGNVWHQIGPEPEPDPDAEIVAHDPPPPARPVVAPAIEAAAPAPAAAPRVVAFAPDEATSAIADDATVAGPPREDWFGKAAVAGGWVLLVALIVLVGWAAVSFRDAVASWMPQTASFYSAAGLPVAASGMDFTDVVYKRQTEDGQAVLAVTGRIVNRADHELAVPLVRVALFDGDRHELYHWTFVPGVATLDPGQYAEFRTRLSSPPRDTHSIEITFARSGE